MLPARNASETTPSPTNCPECRSREIVTTSKTVTDASYWRCTKCGEVWNVERQDRNRRSYRRPFYSGG